MKFEPPIKGMTKRPDSCNGYEPQFGWPGFLGCVSFALSRQHCRQQFTADTGHSIDYILKPRSGLASLIDRLTGRDAAAMAAFADWVAENIWGLEPTA